MLPTPIWFQLYVIANDIFKDLCQPNGKLMGAEYVFLQTVYKFVAISRYCSTLELN